MLDDDPTMADESADEPTEQSAVEAETPDVEAPVSEDAPPPWGEDFDPSRAWNTITHLRDREKELAKQVKEFERLRSDPEAQRAFLNELGYELEDEPEETADDDEPEYDDPAMARIAALEKRLAEKERTESEAAGRAALEEQVEYAKKRMDATFEQLQVSDADEREWIVNKALTLDPIVDENGRQVPDIATAHKAFNELFTRKQKAWADTKNAPVVQPGTAGTQVPDLSDPEQRHEWMRQRLLASQQD